MKKKILILFVILLNMEQINAQKMGYKAMPTVELNKITGGRRLETDTFYQNKDNKAYITIFKDGTGTIFPGAGLGEGLFFENMSYLEPFLKSGVYPVKGDGSFWEKEKERIKDIKASINYYCSALSAQLNYNVELSGDPAYLKMLSEIVNEKLRKKKVDDNLYYYLCIYIGELIRRNTGAEWRLLPQYSLNIYYYPELVKGNTFYPLMGFLMSQFEMAKITPIDIETIIKKSNQFYPLKTDQRYM